jgi:hypothetical protein
MRHGEKEKGIPVVKGGWKGGWKLRLEQKKAEPPEGDSAYIFSYLLCFSWSRRSGLNRRPADYESAALPLSYAGQAGSVKQ